MNNNMFSKAAVWLVIALVLFTVFKQFDKPRVQEGVSYSQFMDDAKTGKVKTVTVQGRNLTVTPADGQKYQIVSPGDIWMVGDLMKYGVQVSGKADDEPNALVSALYYLGPTILIIGFCMSELVSAYPTAGGIYWWAGKLGGPANLPDCVGESSTTRPEAPRVDLDWPRNVTESTNAK